MFLGRTINTCCDENSACWIHEDALNWMAVVHTEYAPLNTGVVQLDCVIVRAWNKSRVIPLDTQSIVFLFHVQK